MKTSFLLLLVLFCFFVSCSSSKKTEGTAAAPEVIHVSFPNDSSHIVVNGDLSDWNMNTIHTDNSTGISTYITTDTANLYIALHIDDQALQMKALRMGMEIYFDVTANHAQNMYLSYPIMSQTDDNPENSFQQSASAKGYKSMKQKLIGQDMIMQTTGFKITPDGMHQKYNNNGPKAIVATDVTNNLVYEAAIPLRDIYGNDFRSAIKNNSQLSIGFKLNAFPKEYLNQTENSASTGGGNGGGFNGGGGGMHGGGRGSGGGFNSTGRTTGYNPVNKEEMVRDSQFWLNVKFN